MELARYETAVWDNPRRPGEGAIAYVSRIAELVAGQPVKVKDVPEARLPYRDEAP